LEQTRIRYADVLYNDRLPQAALGGKTPLDAMNMCFASTLGYSSFRPD
jgi:hypothetical protein